RAGHACTRFERGEPHACGASRGCERSAAASSRGRRTGIWHPVEARTARLASGADPAFQPLPPEFHQVGTNSETTGQEQMRKHSLVVMSALLCICARTSPADESARAQMKGLDEQVQEVKSEALRMAAEP